MAKSSSQKKSHTVPFESRNNDSNIAGGITKRVSALGKHMERAKSKKKKK
jgi:hypothetical protein